MDGHSEIPMMHNATSKQNGESKKEDRRVSRTRDMLQQALLSLMIEKGYEAVTVQDIIDRANVGRSTFYSHFYDKDQLLKYSISRLREVLEQARAVSVSKPSDPETGNNGELRFTFSMAMFEHVKTHLPLYEATVKKSGTIVMPFMQKMFEDITRDEITVLLPSLNVAAIPQELTVKFVASTFFTLLSWWVDNGMPTSIEEIDRIFHRLALSGLGVK
jgi:AcrR family transcriptional regulator